MTRTLWVGLALAAGGFLLTTPASASEWGCKVLLCASSSNPSWHGVAACHPPMEKLIDAMREPGFSWPTCPEAGTAEPGYQRYAECPEGYAVGYSEVGHAGHREPNVCVKHPANCRRTGSGDSDCENVLDRIRRPLRAKPYYFDIKDRSTGTTTRHWFNLNGN